MKRYLSLIILGVVSSLSFGLQQNTDPLNEYLVAEIERLELEQDLFNTEKDNNEIYSIAAIAVEELEEEVEIEFNTIERLPSDFNPKQGLQLIDWDKIKLFNVEEEIEIEKIIQTCVIGS